MLFNGRWLRKKLSDFLILQGLLSALLFCGFGISQKLEASEQSSDSKGVQKDLISTEQSQSRSRNERLGIKLLKAGQKRYREGRYYQAARYFFEAGRRAPRLSRTADSYLAVALLRSGLYQTSSFYFLKVLRKGNARQKKRILRFTGDIIREVGIDLFLSDLLNYTKFSYYDDRNLMVFSYALGKYLFYEQDYDKALRVLSRVDSRHFLYPYARFLVGSTNLHENRVQSALDDFTRCVESAEAWKGRTDGNTAREYDDLMNKCQISRGRALFQGKAFRKADFAYDRVDKRSWAFPDALFEQGWVAYANKDYNRALGKLVTYKSPALSYYFKPEIYVLRAMSYMALCKWSEALAQLKEFRDTQVPGGQRLAAVLRRHKGDPDYFWRLGKQIQTKNLTDLNSVERALQPVIQSSEIRKLQDAERALAKERSLLRSFSRASSKRDALAEFLEEVLSWRLRNIKEQGGTQIRRGGLFGYREILETSDQLSYVRLELLSKVKGSLKEKRNLTKRDEDSLVVPVPQNRWDQYLWVFNGEFWADEIGDYVFALASECKEGEEP